MRIHLLAIAVAWQTSVSGVARADVAAAGRAFSDGQAAQLEGDFDRAAQSFELAYSIAPTKEALRSAVSTRRQAGQLARAAMLAELLAARYAADPASVKLANDVIAEARPKLARLTVSCGAPCTLAIEGRAVSLTAAVVHVAYVPAGRVSCELSFTAGGTLAREISLAIGDDRRLDVEPPKPAAPAPAPIARRVAPADPGAPAPPDATGLAPWVCVGTGVVALGLAGAGAWSGLDTRNAHDAYLANPTHDAYVDGRHKQLRTNLLFGGAAVAGLATAAIGVLWTRWSDGESRPVTVEIRSSSAVVSVRGSF